MKKKQRAFIESAHAAGVRPVRSKMGNLSLSHAGKKIMLSSGQKQLDSGKVYYELAGEAFPEVGTTFARGNVEFAVVGGKRLRTWDASSNSYKYTAAGKTFYSKGRSQYIVHVPITIKGQRDGKRGGTSYTRPGFRPMADLPGITEIFRGPADVRLARIKGVVEGSEGLGESNENWTVDLGGEWSFSELKTPSDLETHADLRQSLDKAPMSWGWLLFPDKISK